MNYIEHLQFTVNLMSKTLIFSNEANFKKISFPDSMKKWFILNCKVFSMNVKKGLLSLKKSLRIVHEEMPDIYH